MKNYDVVIVGAGLAGLQCAGLLGRSGRRVLLIDRKTSLTDSIHTTGIFVRRTLEDFALPEDCLGPPVRHVTLYSPARRSMNLESPHDEFRVGRMSLLYAHYLKECLRVGVDWSHATRYMVCEQSEKDSIVRFESSGREWSVRTRYLVGADGALSRVARDLGLDLNSEWIVGVEDVLHGVPLDGAPRFHCLLDPRIAPGYLAWIINDGEETHVGVGGYAARFSPVEALNEFRRSLGKMFDFSRAKQVERRGGRIPVGGVLRRISCERGLLLGDAAGAVSPLTAGGLDPCLRLSKLAAGVIENYLATGNKSALAAYSGELFRARFTSRLFMRRFISFVEHPALMEAACAAMRLPLARVLARQVFFGHGSFPDTEPSPIIPAAV